jgi:DNA-binding transcriptional ArsR family regulator
VNDPLHRFKADIFQALAHPTRIAILDLVSEGELSAGDLNRLLGMEQANVSQHLGILRSKHLVTTRKAGNQVFYSVRDPIITSVLELMRSYFHAHLSESMDMLDALQRVPEPAA